MKIGDNITLRIGKVSYILEVVETFNEEEPTKISKKEIEFEDLQDDPHMNDEPVQEAVILPTEQDKNDLKFYMTKLNLWHTDKEKRKALLAPWVQKCFAGQVTDPSMLMKDRQLLVTFIQFLKDFAK